MYFCAPVLKNGENLTIKAFIVNTRSYNTVSANKNTVEHKWLIVDAKDKVVGRLATEIAHRLKGKHKPYYTPHVDCGDYIIILNADQVKFTGKKMDDKQYVTFSGYPGGQKKRTPREMLEKRPEGVIENAVRGMLPKNRLGRAMFKKLFVYTGETHPHAAQKPETLEI